MAETFTNKLEKFFDNNTPGGYITTSVSISDSDLDQRINTAVKTEVSGQGFAKASELSSYVKITSLASVATSGSYNDLKDKPTIPAATSVSINRNLTEGTKIATITINGSDTELFAPVGGNNSSDTSVIEWSNIVNKPNLLTENEVNDKINDLNQTIRGTNNIEELRVRDSITSEIIENYSHLLGIKQIIMSSHVVLDLSTTYHYDNFGENDFYEEYNEDNEVHLIPDIFIKYNNGRTVIYLKYRNNYWLVTQFIDSINEYGIIISKLQTNYNFLKTTLDDNLASIDFTPSYGIVLFDKTTQVTYFKFYTQTLNFLETSIFYSVFQRNNYTHPDENGANYVYPTAPDLDDTNLDTPTWSRVVTINTLTEILKDYQKKT